MYNTNPNGYNSTGGQGEGPHAGWEYYNGSWHPGGGGTPPPKAPRRGQNRVLSVVATLLACAVFGFGGAWAALSLGGGSTGGTTVVYKAPEAIPTGTGEGGALTAADVSALAGQSVVSVNTENVVRAFGGNYVSQGAGSGVILTEDGYIITNNHVVDGAQYVTVVLPDGSEHSAVVVGTAPANDIAVLKINVTGLVPAVFGDSDMLRVGEDVLAIGNPLGTLSNTVTDGIISALGREINIDGYNMNLLQMSAAVSPGNSGGGLFNLRGELIGVVNAKSSGENAEGLGFAIPSNTAMQIAQQLIENTTLTSRPGIGITIEDVLNDQQAAAAGYPGPGVYVQQVNRGGAGEAAGLLAGDRLLAADGHTVSVSTDLSAVLEGKSIGDVLVLQVERNGEVLELTVELGEMLQAA